MRSSPSTPGASPVRLGTVPRSPAPLRSTSSSSDIFFSPAMSASRMSTSSRPQTSGGYIQASEGGFSQVLTTVKVIQERIEETERAFHRQSLEREDLEQQLRYERAERQGLQQLFNQEKDERAALTEQVKRLQATVEAAAAETATTTRKLSEIPARVERLESDVRACARSDETQAWLGDQDRRLHERLGRTSAVLDEYHKDFVDTSATLAEALKSKQFKLMALADAQKKQETTTHDLVAELSTHRVQTSDALRSAAEDLSAARAQLDERCDQLHGRADGLVSSVTDLNGTLRQAMAAQVDGVRATLAEDAAAALDRQKRSEDKFSDWCQRLEDGAAEKVEGLRSEVAEGLELAESRREEAVAAERSSRTEQCSALAADLASRADGLGASLAQATEALSERCLANESAVQAAAEAIDASKDELSARLEAESSQRQAALEALRESTDGAAKALGESTASALEGAAEEAERGATAVRAELAQQAEDVLAIRSVMDSKIEMECAGLESKLQLTASEAAKATAEVSTYIQETVVTRLEELGGSIGATRDEFGGRLGATTQEFGGKLGALVARLVPCEDKLLECALKASRKRSRVALPFAGRESAATVC